MPPPLLDAASAIRGGRPDVLPEAPVVRRCCVAGEAGESVQLVEGVLQSLFRDWFEQVLHAVGLKGLEGVFVVSGSEDYRLAYLDALEYLETVAVRELDIHEYQVYFVFSQGLH